MKFFYKFNINRWIKHFIFYRKIKESVGFIGAYRCNTTLHNKLIDR